MSTPNLFIKRITSIAGTVSPSQVALVPAMYTAESGTVATGNNPMYDLALPTLVDPRIAWPAPTVVDSLTTANVAIPGIRILKYIGGVLTPISYEVCSCRVISGSQIARRSFAPGATDFEDGTQFQMGSYTGKRILQGVTTSAGSVLPAAGIVDVSGQLREARFIGQSEAAVPGFGRGANAIIDSTATSSFKRISAIESLVQAPLPTPFTDAIWLANWSDWVDPAVPANNAYLSVEGACVFDLGLAIDPALIVNVANAASDLYIYVPYSCGASFTANNNAASYTVMPQSSRLSAISTTQGAHGYILIPLTHLKSTSLYSAAKLIPQSAVSTDYVNNLLMMASAGIPYRLRSILFGNIYASLGQIQEQVIPLMTAGLVSKANCGPNV